LATIGLAVLAAGAIAILSLRGGDATSKPPAPTAVDAAPAQQPSAEPPPVPVEQPVAPPATAVVKPSASPQKTGASQAAVAKAPSAERSQASAAEGSNPSAVERARKSDAGKEQLQLARAKFDASLYDQALTDLKAIVSENPSGPNAPAAYLLIGAVYERQNRPDDASATYVELRSRYPASAVAPEATFRLADNILRSKRPDRDRAARELLNEVVTQHPATPWAPRALAKLGSIEEHLKLRTIDAELGMSVPAALISYRTLLQKYPAEIDEPTLEKLAEMYEDVKRFELAARALDHLVARFPDNSHDAAWRAAELYEKKVKNMELARAAYLRVPPTSKRFKDAQKRALP
jgi:TolA-binding protein